MAVKPLFATACQAGEPLTSLQMLTLAQQTEEMWQTCGGNRRTWVWPDPASAPSADLVTFNETYSLEQGDSTEAVDLCLPWHQPAGFDTIDMEVWVAKRGAGSIAIDLMATAGGMLTTEIVADVDSPFAHCAFGHAPPASLWTEDHPSWRLAKALLRCGPITHGGTRSLTLSLMARMPTETEGAWSAVSTVEVGVKIYMVRAWDVPCDRTGLR